MWRATRLLGVGRRLGGLAGAAGLAAAATHHGFAAADAAVPAADAALAEADAPEKEKEELCLHIMLHPASQVELLERFTPTLARVLGERVWLRSCVAVASEELPARALAYAEDTYSQSVLIALDERVLSTQASAAAGQGYPVLPIALAEDPAPPPPPPPPPASSEAAEPAAKPAAEPEPEPEGPTVAELVEGIWRELEAAGVVEITRDEDSLPSSIRLPTGATEWRGELGKPGSERMVRVVLIEPGEPGGLRLTATSAKPECGFCRFMKNGPCGEAFVAWEACIDRAREKDTDFVEMCGLSTMALKECTDKHPEYYGELGGGDDDNADKPPPDAAPPSEAPQPPAAPPREAAAAQSAQSK